MTKLVLHYFSKVLFALFCSAVKQKHQNYSLKKNQTRPAAEARTNYFNRQGIVWVSISVLKSHSFFFRSWHAATVFSKGFEQTYNYVHSLLVCTYQPPVVIFSWIFYSSYLYIWVWIKTNSYFVLCFQKLAYSFPWLLSSPFIIWAMWHQMKKRKIKKMIERLESKICEGRKRLTR